MRLIQNLGVNPEKNHKIYEKIVLNEKLNFRVDKVREKFSIPDNNLLSDKEFISFLEDVNLEKESKKIITDFDLPRSWVDIVHRYIVDHEFITNKNSGDLRLETNESENLEREFYLRITPETSIKDIKDIWFIIQKRFKEYGYKKTRKKKSKNFNRNEEIFHLKEKGKNNAQISIYIEDKYKKDLTFGAIKTIISKKKKVRKG